MTTCGIPCSIDATWPAWFAYQVCEWTTSAPATSLAIARSTAIVCSVALAPASSDGTG
ncbi:hypothetical protein BC477_13520 [Clavibacter michiganensis subsp. michiganensis]|uniref:Uncharacterized protein n=1 Tax=Clavibacter michiganensis subsp. michiganensis TaxID=33013 RepID=A0A251XJ11_CLAMM|nr:hypothetical protein BC477_13520 [Clavibacter michiganensis subsp. michiganensis]OUE02816.1 hypothetical protein CMMCAS07_12425 [Clavibacter michiganensis subsp. michiganensis]